jgi:TfoX/Sxy family transcriptional regulator of competence genes
MAPGSMPKPGEEAKAAFRELVPGEPGVALKPMFGNLSAFVNGNMFAGLFGDDLFVRVPPEQGAEIVGQGGSEFQPMPGRPMKGYYVLPKGWRQDPAGARGWIQKGLSATSGMPAKQPKPRKS